MVVETDFDNHVQLLDKLLGTLSYVLPAASAAEH